MRKHVCWALVIKRKYYGLPEALFGKSAGTQARYEILLNVKGCVIINAW